MTFRSLEVQAPSGQTRGVSAKQGQRRNQLCPGSRILTWVAIEVPTGVVTSNLASMGVSTPVETCEAQLEMGNAGCIGDSRLGGGVGVVRDCSDGNARGGGEASPSQKTRLDCLHE
jgi:hypothetical protein